MKQINIIIIGMGKMGRIRYEGMHKHGGYNIVAICDAYENNLIGYREPAYTDWKKCIDEVESDAVMVCTFNNVIPEIVCYALRKRRHIFSEKPPGRNLEDTLLMKKAYDETSGLVLKFGFNHRYHNSVIEAKALIDSGIVGKVICARGVYGKAGSLTFANEWRNDKSKSGGGILLDQGIHMVDLLYYFLGEFTDIKSEVDTLHWENISTEDSAFAIMKTIDGKVASLHSSALQWKHKFDLDIICTNGYIALNGLLTATQSYGEERMTYYRKDLAAKTGALGKPLEHTLSFDSDESWDYEHKEFYECIVENKPVKNGTIDDAVHVMQTIKNIYEVGKH